ncbi:MAG: TldD/PmbA family protein [Lachnospiraceae bacterium]|nr:TldD/PmbA family protein [Lachnospiraceae bacterium]
MTDLKSIAGQIGDEISKAGVRKAQYTVAAKETREFNVDGGEFSLFRTLFDNCLVITVYKDDKKGSISTNSFDREAITRAVSNCIQSAEAAIADPAYDIAPKQENKIFEEGSYEPDVDKLFARTKELLETIKERHPKILMEQMIVEHVKKHEIYQNTNGTEFETFSGSYGISLMFSGHEGNSTTSFFGSSVTTDNLDRPFIELGSVEKDLCDVEAQLSPIPVEGKFEGIAVLTPGSLGSFLYSAMENFVSDITILDKTSIWVDKLGEKVAADCLTLSLAPLDERICCGERHTSDGFLSENYDLIQNGVLRSYMLSLYVANKSDYAPAKNTSYAAVIEGGDTAYEDMIKGIKKGIIVGRFSGGSPSSNGDFSGVAKNSFLIEDGQIKGALSETMINGNLSDILKNIVAISKETVADGTSVLPYIAVSGVTISGK